MAVSVAVCDIFSVKEWPDLEMALIDHHHHHITFVARRYTYKNYKNIGGKHTNKTN